MCTYSMLTSGGLPSNTLATNVVSTVRLPFVTMTNNSYSRSACVCSVSKLNEEDVTSRTPCPVPKQPAKSSPTGTFTGSKMS